MIIKDQAIGESQDNTPTLAGVEERTGESKGEINVTVNWGHFIVPDIGRVRC